jgi:hypothetical protein
VGVDVGVGIEDGVSETDGVLLTVVGVVVDSTGVDKSVETGVESETDTSDETGVEIGVETSDDTGVEVGVDTELMDETGSVGE